MARADNVNAEPLYKSVWPEQSGVNRLYCVKPAAISLDGLWANNRPDLEKANPNKRESRHNAFLMSLHRWDWRIHSQG